MSFTQVGTTITQDAATTDTSLSGLSGLTGVTTVADAGFTVYDISNNRLVVAGTLTIDPEVEMLIQSDGVTTPAVNVTGTLNLGRVSTKNSVDAYSVGTVMVLNCNDSSFTETSAAMNIQSGGSLNWYGGIINTFSNITFSAGSTPIIYSANAGLFALGLAANGEWPQIRQRAANLDIRGFSQNNFIFTAVNVATIPVKGLSAVHSAEVFARSFSSPSNEFFVLENFITGGGNDREYGLWQSKWARFKNCVTGSNIDVQGRNAPRGVGTNTGLGEVTGDLSVTATDTSGTALTGFGIYLRDRDHGVRQAANVVGTNPDYQPDREYIDIESGGSADINDVLLYVYLNAIDDSRGETNDKEDNWIVRVRADGKIHREDAFIFKGADGVELASRNQVDDALVTQNRATATAHTGITITEEVSPVTWEGEDFSITVTGNLTTNPSLTNVDIYNYLHYVRGGSSSNTTIGGRNGIAWHVFMDSLSSTVRGTYDGDRTDKGVRIIDQAGNAFTGITSFTADNGNVVSLVNTGLSFAGLVAGTQIVVCDTGTQTERYRNNSTGTTATWSETYSSDGTVDYTIMQAGYSPIRVTGVAISDSVLSVAVNQLEDRAYSASSGLTFGTTATINTGTERFGVTVATTVQNWYSFWIEAWIAQATLVNTTFPLSTFGPDSYSLNDGYEFDGTSSIGNLNDDGFRYFQGGSSVAEWVAVVSIGEATGFTGEYQQVDGSGTTDAAASGSFDQVIQTYGDASHGNFDYRDHLVLKYQINGYREARADVPAIYGITALEPVKYVVALEPTAISAATGDPGLTITVTDQGATPVSWQGLNWSITVTDNATQSTAEQILRELNYNLSLDATYQGKDPFNWPEMVIEAGSSYETVRGYTEGAQSSTLKGVRVVLNDGTTPHPDFARQQSDDGTYYVLPVTDDLVVNSSESGSQIIVFTAGTQTELDSEASASSLTYTHSDETVDITVMKAGFIPFRQTGVVLSGDVTITAQLVASREYDASHGLTYTTDASWSRSLNQLTVPTFGPTVQGVFSLMIDSFISQTALRNTAFNLEMDGANSLYLVNDSEGVNDATIANMTRGGVGYINTAGSVTAEWFGVLSVGDNTAGETGEYQQIDGSTTTDARATGDFDEIIKMYGDGTHGNFDYRGHAVFKYQINGFYQARVDILDLFGISTLTPTLYTIPLSPSPTGISTGDPAISITITDHTASPITVGGKSFDFEVVDNGTNTAEAILREINYNLSLDATYQTKDPFNWPDMVIESGGSYETEYGRVEGQDTTTTFHGFYVSRSSADHPDFSRFQSNDGTYYTPATVAQISAPNLTDGRIQIVNETGRTASAWAATTAYTLYNKVLRSTGTGSESGIGLYFQCTTAGTTGGTEPAWPTTPGATVADGTVTWTCRAIEYANTTTTTGYTTSWTDHVEFDNGDQIRLRWTDEDNLEISAIGVATADSTTTFLDTPQDDTVYDGYGIDGSTVTEYSADYPNVQVDVNDPDNVFLIDRFYAWHKYNLTLADGIRNFFGAVTAVNASNIVINTTVVDIFFDNTKATSARQGDNIVIQRSDGAYPQVTTTSGGGGLGFYYTGVGYTVETGVSGLTPEESAKITALTFTKTGELDVNLKSVTDITVTGTGTSGDPWGP